MVGGQAVQVLLVEDNPADARLIEEMLAGTQGSFRCTHVSRLSAAIELLSAEKYDVTLLDLSLPDAQSTEGIERLRRDHPQHPIVVMTGYDDDVFALNAVHEGAQDYLVKGRCDAAQVARTLRYAVERKRMDERIAYLANHDDLTGLANRALFMDRMQHAVTRAERNNWRLAVMFIDLDGFKAVNDALGHHTGDRLLTEVARRLRACVRECDTVARLGGDEFAVILEDVSGNRGASVVAEKMQHNLRGPIAVELNELQVTVSIGIALYPDAGRDPGTLLQQADTAMYRMKRSGKNGYGFATQVMDPAEPLAGVLEQDVREALGGQEFLLYYQPFVEPVTGRVIGLEALLRWRHPRHGVLSPPRFLPLLEQTALIAPVGEWVLRTVAQQIGAWRKARLALVPVSVNVSPCQLQSSNFAATVACMVGESGIDPGLLELELTERLFIDDTPCARALLERVAQLGVKLAIDDFGAGYGTFSYMKRFPIATLKIDRMFIQDVTRDATSAAVARFVMGFAHELGIQVIAEGVETAEQLEFLRGIGVDAVQGFLFSQPLAAPAATAMLRRGHCAEHPVRASA